MVLVRTKKPTPTSRTSSQPSLWEGGSQPPSLGITADDWAKLLHTLRSIKYSNRQFRIIDFISIPPHIAEWLVSCVPQEYRNELEDGW